MSHMPTLTNTVGGARKGSENRTARLTIRGPLPDHIGPPNRAKGSIPPKVVRVVSRIGFIRTLPAEATAGRSSAPSATSDATAAAPTASVGPDAQRAALKVMCAGLFDADSKGVVATLLKLVCNLLSRPGDPGKRRINGSNAAFRRRVGQQPGGVAFLRACGFRSSGRSIQGVHSSPLQESSFGRD